MLNIILFGPPGAGKGTQSDKIIDTYQLIHISTGEILRAEIAAETELGQKARLFIDKGELVPDKIVISMVKTKISANKGTKGFIFDGFPRTVAQAEELDRLLLKEKASISGMIALDVEHYELVKRLHGRAKISERVDDANVNIIENRIEIYKKSTLPVMDFYKAQKKLELINGMGSIEDIFERIQLAIDKLTN